MDEWTMKLSPKLDWQSFKQENTAKAVGGAGDYDIFRVNHQLRDALKNMNEGVLILNSQLRFVFLNELAKLLLHPPTPDDLTGKKLSDVFPHKSVLCQELFKAHANQVPMHFEYSPIDNRQFIEMDVFPHQEGLMVYLRDITNRKHFEKCQQYAFKEIIAVLDQIAGGFCTLDCSWKFIYLNNGAGDFFGKAPGRLVGKDIWREFPQIKGTIIEEQYKQSLVKQIPFCFETRGLVQDQWYEQQVFPSPKGLTVYIKDVTDRKRLEMEITRLDRLNSVGEIAASIGHEIRNPMTTVRGFLQILGDKEECLKFKESFALMMEELDRCNSMITEFLSFAGKREYKSERCNLNDVIEAIKPLTLADAVMTDKNIVFELEPIPDLMLDGNEIRQLILNLTRNGLDAMTPGKTLFIRTFRDGRQVTLEVRDQGAGIDRSIIDKLGTPFITTKAKGTGLGLAVCYRIAEKYHATIDYETGKEGTAFFVRFSCEKL